LMCEAWTTDRHHVKYLTSIRYQAVTQSLAGRTEESDVNGMRELQGNRKARQLPRNRADGPICLTVFVVSRWLPPLVSRAVGAGGCAAEAAFRPGFDARL
jgi:hypothetical protein